MAAVSPPPEGLRGLGLYAARAVSPSERAAGQTTSGVLVGHVTLGRSPDHRRSPGTLRHPRGGAATERTTRAQSRSSCGKLRVGGETASHWDAVGPCHGPIRASPPSALPRPSARPRAGRRPAEPSTSPPRRRRRRRAPRADPVDGGAASGACTHLANGRRADGPSTRSGDLRLPGSEGQGGAGGRGVRP